MWQDARGGGVVVWAWSSSGARRACYGWRWCETGQRAGRRSTGVVLSPRRHSLGFFFMMHISVYYLIDFIFMGYFG